MAHEKVERRSISSKDWSSLVFSRINDFIYLDRKKINGWSVREGIYSPDRYLWDDERPVPIEEGQLWGGPDTTGVFTCEVKIPKEFKDKKVYFYMLAACEVMIEVDGKYVGGIDPNRDRFLFVEKANIEKTYTIKMEAYTRSKPDDDRSLTVKQMKGCAHVFLAPEFVLIDEKMLDFHYDLVALSTAAYSDLMEDSLKDILTRHINEVVKLMPPYDASRQAYQESLDNVKAYLKKHVYNNDQVYGKIGKLACVAYSHLDIAYHWKVAQTVQKNARTVLIQLNLMEKYKDFSYAHTQAWTYEMLEKYYPELFKEVENRIKVGQWEVMGGLYVEPDCNLISAESYIRQIMYGKMYFLEKFGIEVDNCWLPDVFGNSPIMPQILKKGGIHYFVSNKMSTWNDTNRFPYNNFIWQGIDGSQIYACVPPTHFISWAEPDQAIGHWDAFQNKEICDESLQMYGYGDGGSGVTEEMLEMYKRQEQLPFIPKQRLTTGKEYLHHTFTEDVNFPVWEGDLYLEMHRGTFTTKGEMKLENRKDEFKLFELEWLTVLSALKNKKNDQTVFKIRDIWKKLLLNQFHDIIPGSHTTAVGIEAMDLYQEIANEIDGLSRKINREIFDKSYNGKITLINTIGTDRQGIAIIDMNSKELYQYTKNGKEYFSQTIQNCQGEQVNIIETPVLNKLECLTIECEPLNVFENGMKIKTERMENDFVLIEIDKEGQLSRIFDKTTQRDILKSGAVGNQWQMFDDRPGVYNAWDIVENYKDYPIELQGTVKKEIIENGPVCIGLRIERTFSKSRYIQIIRIYRLHRRIDFETWVDWKEDQKLLKVAFPLAYKGSEYRVDTSAGVMSHPNHKNTTWQQAKYEVPCHKWIEMSAGNIGVAILNNCKYGCDVENEVMRLSLLRAPIRPDRHSDRGEHNFTYSVFIHDGQWQRSDLVQEAFNINYPIRATLSLSNLSEVSNTLLRISNNDVLIQSVKFAEDGSGDIIVRLVEIKQTFGIMDVKVFFDYQKVFYCDLLERFERDADINQIHYQAYEIISLRFQR